MFEQLLANLLNKFLGDCVDNLEKKQLNVGIWSGNWSLQINVDTHIPYLYTAGEVSLRGLKLKKEALEKFNLPLEVVGGTLPFTGNFSRSQGYLGELALTIPWHNLKNKPVQVKMSNLYLLTRPYAQTDVILHFNDIPFLNEIVRCRHGRRARPKSQTRNSGECWADKVPNSQSTKFRYSIEYSDIWRFRRRGEKCLHDGAVGHQNHWQFANFHSKHSHPLWRF